MTVDLYVMSCLCNIDTIVHVEEALWFHGHRELFVLHVEEDISRTWVRCRDSEVIHLAHEDDTNAIDITRVEAGFVHHRCEAEFTKYNTCMLFPQTGSLRVSLHR